MEMKTRYDWKAGKRGELLSPEGSRSELQNVVADIHVIHDVLRVLYLQGRLYGQALVDARATYPNELDSGARNWGTSQK